MAGNDIEKKRLLDSLSVGEFYQWYQEVIIEAERIEKERKKNAKN